MSSRADNSNKKWFVFTVVTKDAFTLMRFTQSLARFITIRWHVSLQYADLFHNSTLARFINIHCFPETQQLTG